MFETGNSLPTKFNALLTPSPKVSKEANFAKQYFWISLRRSIRCGAMDRYSNRWNSHQNRITWLIFSRPLFCFETTSHSINSGVPQGSILDPLLYTIHTSDIPENINTTIDSFTDEIALLSCHEKATKASKNLQKHL